MRTRIRYKYASENRTYQRQSRPRGRQLYEDVRHPARGVTQLVYLSRHRRRDGDAKRNARDTPCRKGKKKNHDPGGQNAATVATRNTRRAQNAKKQYIFFRESTNASASYPLSFNERDGKKKRNKEKRDFGSYIQAIGLKIVFSERRRI